MNNPKDDFYRRLPKHLVYNPVKTVKIGDRIVGEGQPVFIIAEAGANHRGNIENALRLIELAAKAGADAVKFQHLTHDEIAADTPVYEDWRGKQIGVFSEFYRSAEMPYEWTERLVAHAKKHNIMFLSTPFDKSAVDLLDKINIPAFKIASYEITDDILLRYIARKGKPIILSTGMAYLEEVAHAVRVIQEEGNSEIILLHCTSIYPPKSFVDLNLRATETLMRAFNLPVGYSDHSKPPYLAAPIVAVAMGACVIEKHFTIGREGGSNDDPNSLEFEELKRTVEEIRNTEQALSLSGIKQPVCYSEHVLGKDEIADRYARRSLYAARDIKTGEVLTEEMITTLRPWALDGVEPKDAGLVIGKQVLKDINERDPITWGHLMM